MRLRTALAKSKNMVSIRILDAIGVKYAQDYVTRFGFDADRHPPYLTMALGSGTVTAWQMARAYAVFANGGYLVQPYFIQKIVDDRGNPLGVARPQRAGDESAARDRRAQRVHHGQPDAGRDARAAPAARAASLGRKDIAGKTGTTNEFIDAWFAGYNPALVGVAWVGFDQPKTLGRNQTGGLVALPIWIGYMEQGAEGRSRDAAQRARGRGHRGHVRDEPGGAERRQAHARSTSTASSSPRTTRRHSRCCRLRAAAAAPADARTSPGAELLAGQRGAASPARRPAPTPAWRARRTARRRRACRARRVPSWRKWNPPDFAATQISRAAAWRLTIILLAVLELDFQHAGAFGLQVGVERRRLDGALQRRQRARLPGLRTRCRSCRIFPANISILAQPWDACRRNSPRRADPGRRLRPEGSAVPARQAARRASSRPSPRRTSRCPIRPTPTSDDRRRSNPPHGIRVPQRRAVRRTGSARGHRAALRHALLRLFARRDRARATASSRARSRAAVRWSPTRSRPTRTSRCCR